MRHRILAAIPCMLALSVAGRCTARRAGDAGGAVCVSRGAGLGTSLNCNHRGAQADADRAHVVVMAEVERLRGILSTYMRAAPWEGECEQERGEGAAGSD